MLKWTSIQVRMPRRRFRSPGERRGAQHLGVTALNSCGILRRPLDDLPEFRQTFEGTRALLFDEQV